MRKKLFHNVHFQFQEKFVFLFRYIISFLVTFTSLSLFVLSSRNNDGVTTKFLL